MIASSPKTRRISPLVYILLSGVLGVTGQLILKAGLATLGRLDLRIEALTSVIVALATNPLVILGLMIYAAGTFFWLIALSNVDLGYAYPFASLNYLLILVASWAILHEPFVPTRLVGVALIGVGVWAITRTSSRTNIQDDSSSVFTQATIPEGTGS
jgi:drug/metabolite transporter (DMT)-like permease